VVRLRVEDLHDHQVRPKLMMPKSGKGGGRNRAQKKAERYSVPITTQLAARLRAAAKGSADDAPLLLQNALQTFNPLLGEHGETPAPAFADGGIDLARSVLLGVQSTPLQRIQIGVVSFPHATNFLLADCWIRPTTRSHMTSPRASI